MSKYLFRQFLNGHRGEVFRMNKITGSKKKTGGAGIIPAKKWSIFSKDVIVHLTIVFNQWLQNKMWENVKVNQFQGVNKHIMRKWVAKRIKEGRIIWNKEGNRLKII